MKKIKYTPHCCRYCMFTNADKSIIEEHEKRCAFNLKEVKKNGENKI